jgi:capsular polysaccharide export protein
VIIDDAGIYGDARRESRLERLARAAHTPAQRERAHQLIALWRKGRLSEYNDAREETGLLPSRYVLVIDEPVNGRALADALATPSSFERMLEAAIAGHPDCTILVKGMPGRSGYLDLARVALRPGIQVYAGDSHPAGLLERAEAVYTVRSQWGFEALLWGRPVHTFGLPFYAGWGLTADSLPAPERRAPVALEDFMHAALVDYSRYRHPESGEGCEVEAVLDWLGLQRRMRERFPATLHAAGFSFRKRRFVCDFLQGSTVHFIRDARQAPVDGTLVLWGRQTAPADLADSGAGNPSTARRNVIRIEDGFLRSVGLGAGLARPLSWVLDRQGIHYDSTAPSEMEHLLKTMEFAPELLARARALREAIVAGGVTKYNLNAAPWKRPAEAGKVILVPGQVETDASLRYGAPGVRTNLGLLQAVRATNPEAYVVYKPHPDVVAGLRAGGEGEEGAQAWCDEQIAGAPMDQLLKAVDEVHVLTSLAGFEALLRGRGVTCHGQPFYAGWGLTTDVIPVARRRRRLSLDALLAVVLIVYPTYISRATGFFTTPERVIEELRQWRAESAGRRSGPVGRLARRLYHGFLRRLEDRGAAARNAR